MNVEEKLRAIRDVIQQDVGNRGLARDPKDNLITACPDDFANACRSIAGHRNPVIAIVTGFTIPTVDPPRGETDGPLGALFLLRALTHAGVEVSQVITDGNSGTAMRNGSCVVPTPRLNVIELEFRRPELAHVSHLIALERVGPSHNEGRCYTMRGRDITDLTHMVPGFSENPRPTTIGIGDGGNEIGMGKIPHETIVKNILNGDRIHCRVPTDHLIVAGVSNWGAYALAAGVALLRGADLPHELFDAQQEKLVLEAMVSPVGRLVDGVTGKQTATVDGLSWDDYIKPLVEIGKIMRL